MAAPTRRPEDFVFEPLLPFFWSSVFFDNANHEAAHGVVGVLLGITILEARIDAPDVHTYGVVSVVKCPGDDWEQAAAYIAPLVMDGTAPPEPDPSAAIGSDLHKASVYWKTADRCEWPELLRFVRWLLLSPSSRRSLRAVSSALLAEGALPGDRVKQLVLDAGKGP